jgi:hypothetical protein
MGQTATTAKGETTMSTVLAEYAPSKGGGSNYRIILGNDGVTYCDCPGWRNRKNCKHLLDYTLQGAMSAVSKMSHEETASIRETVQGSQVFDDDSKMNDAIAMATQMLKG